MTLLNQFYINATFLGGGTSAEVTLYPSAQPSTQLPKDTSSVPTLSNLPTKQTKEGKNLKKIARRIN